MRYETFSLIAPCFGLQGAVAQYAANQTKNTMANPFPVLGSFMSITQHTGPTALRSI